MFTYTNPRKSLQVQLHNIEQAPLTTNRKRKLLCIGNLDENISPSKMYDPGHAFPETSLNMNPTELSTTLSEKFESLISKSKNEQLCLSSIATAESSSSQLIEHNTITPLKSKNAKGVKYLSKENFCLNQIQNKADYEVKASCSYDYKKFLMHSRNTRGCQPLEDHNLNSQNNGFFSVLSEDSPSLSRFEPKTVIEKKNLSLNISQSYSVVCYKGIPEIDDPFLDNINAPARLYQDSVPVEFNTLINGDIFALHSPIIKPIVRQRNPKYDSDTPQKVDLVFGEVNNTDVIVKKRKLFNKSECPEKSIVSKLLKPKVDLSMSFGSPRLDTGNTSLTAPLSEIKTSLFDYGFCKNSVSNLRRSFSTNEDTIKAAFDKEDNESNLIGDYSQSFILPLLSLGHHSDLRSISPDTLAHLLEGAFNECIDSYLIIDCRYPYEYEGGHIRGAINIFTKEQLFKDYTEDKLGKKSHKTDKINVKRNVLIFHCEFSLERGPSLSRYLRNADREINSMCYPYLDYPEIYLLDGGYCKFYSQHSRLCVPSSYRSMYDPAHISELKKFRSKSKTWACHNEATPRLACKNTLKKLGFN